MAKQTCIDIGLATANLRSIAYSYLAWGFRKPQEKKFEHGKVDFVAAWKSVVDCLEPDGEFLPILKRLEENLRDQTGGSLFTQYNHLFSAQGGIKVSLYETDHTKETPQHALCQGYELGDIAGFYKAFGLEVSEDSPDRGDFIASELEFMSFLAAKEAMTIKSGQAENLEIVQDGQNKFIKDHLGRWTQSLSKSLAEADHSGFHANLGDLTDLWVKFDESFMGPIHFQEKEYQHVRRETDEELREQKL